MARQRGRRSPSRRSARRKKPVKTNEEAMDQWIKDGTVDLDYMESVLGDPVGTVSVPVKK